MSVDPKQARAALSRYVPNRLIRLVRSTHGGLRLPPQPPPGNLKAAERQMARFRQEPGVSLASAFKKGSRIACILIRRTVVKTVAFNEQSELYECEAIHYQIKAIKFHKGEMENQIESYIIFPPHAIQRWAERADGLDLKAPDMNLLKRLDREAETVLNHINDLRFPLISRVGKGVWITQMSRTAGSGHLSYGVYVQTFLPGETLTGNRKLYYDGTMEFTDPTHLQRMLEVTPEHHRRLRERGKEVEARNG